MFQCFSFSSARAVRILSENRLAIVTLRQIFKNTLFLSKNTFFPFKNTVFVVVEGWQVCFLYFFLSLFPHVYCKRNIVARAFYKENTETGKILFLT